MFDQILNKMQACTEQGESTCVVPPEYSDSSGSEAGSESSIGNVSDARHSPIEEMMDQMDPLTLPSVSEDRSPGHPSGALAPRRSPRSENPCEQPSSRPATAESGRLSRLGAEKHSILPPISTS